jgi:late competence protein required for DNA uptake (superfamily II DNA/RNA helicase)
MLSRIFRIPDSKPSPSSKAEHQNVLATFLDRNTAHEPSKTLIGGPHGCGKTSLLFSLAITFAEEGKDVLFICPRKVSTLTVLPEGEHRPSTSTLQKIHMVYLESKDEFLKYMASIHLNLDKTFHCMIVDNLDSYVAGIGKNEELTVMARLLAFTVDAYNFELEKL